MKINDKNPALAVLSQTSWLIGIATTEREVKDWAKDDGALLRKDLAGINAIAFLNKTNARTATPLIVSERREDVGRMWEAVASIPGFGEEQAKSKTVAAQPVVLKALSKMRPHAEGGCRFGIVLNGSPLFTGGAGSGESEIRRYVLENDLVEAIIALPTDMFYNTGIATYVWVLSNKKPAARFGKVQLIDASSFWQKMRKSLGSKRKEMGDKHLADVTRLFGAFVEAELATVLDAEGKEAAREIVLAGEQPPAAPDGGKVKLAPLSRIFDNKSFGYRTITVERPLRDEQGNLVLGQRGKAKGQPQPDSSLRDTENVPLAEDVEAYFEREVKPHAADAWIDHEKTKIGYEIPFNRHFYVFEPPRPLAEIDAELAAVTARIQAMLTELAA